MVDIGSNDIAGGTAHDVILSDIGQWVDAIREFHKGVICFLSVVPRLGGLHGLSPQQFCAQSGSLEAGLKELVKSRENLIFHKHKGFYETESLGEKRPLSPLQWSRDGIHPNNPNGRKRYANSLRLAIAKSVRLSKASGKPVV